jgi:HD superfamily phosphohydrolase YqeK
MEGSNEYDNQTIQNEEPIIYISDKIEVDQIMEEKKNPSLQIEISRVSKVC